ncbi:hypothetical protein BO99DRAFT_90707 [Aspergillus violaceofuscus CBS 115571]|uniref:Uncharacterized protein n=1 Tax=Aspergillus violaceofuscus (strain CBS 115571) TaxID=1450538 RepID=A0A2V5HRQ7_ASPV1|nr:hypothetical protein BO99DRAFT_90707 [Aspergillus violaceofuscus CBS 115571]
MKKTGMLLPTISQLPSAVYIFTANPRTSRTVSALPLLPCTVENRTNTGVSRDVSVNTPAVVSSGMALCSVKVPKAPAPRACTTRSGIRSWSKRMIWQAISRSPSYWCQCKTHLLPSNRIFQQRRPRPLRIRHPKPMIRVGDLDPIIRRHRQLALALLREVDGIPREVFLLGHVVFCSVYDCV